MKHDMAKPNRKHVLDRTRKLHKAGRVPLQYGALCWRRKANGLRILLITSRRSKRWVSPKGWPIKGLSPAQTAAREAWEEAGVRGEVSPVSIGFYRYDKWVDRKREVALNVQVFPLEVTELVKRFPEKDDRKLRWMKPGKAARKVREAELARLIKRFAKSVDAGDAQRT